MTISSSSVGMSRSVVSAEGFRKVSMGNSTDDSVWTAKTSRDDPIGEVFLFNKWSVMAGQLSRNARSLHEPFLSRFYGLAGFDTKCKEGHMVLIP